MFKLFIDILSLVLSDDILLPNGFVAYGDIMQFSIMFALIALLCTKDIIGIKYIAISSAYGLGIMLISKIISVYLLEKYSNLTLVRAIAERPDTGALNGFPSGHTCAIFIVTGFVWKRYGYRYGLLMCILGIFVGLSRIYALRHSLIQVICGAILGFTSGYLIAKKRF